MCQELKLIQTNLELYKLEDWSIDTCISQLQGIKGVYCIKNLVTDKLLIGEGDVISGRIFDHIRNKSNNRQWRKDIAKYGKHNLRLIWIIEENDEIQRKLIENKLQIHFKDNCYNQPRREYPTQQELINNQASKQSLKNGNIVQRLNNYTTIQKVNGFDKCWEHNYLAKQGSDKTNQYSCLIYKRHIYPTHVLMYILHYGDICGITSVIHHKCENKRCVNPGHLELVTHAQNIRLSIKSFEDTKAKIEKLSQLGYTNKQIMSLLSTNSCKVSRYANHKFTSRYKGVTKTQYSPGLYRIRSVVKLNNKPIDLGNYNKEIEAAQNRDYFIVKNLLLDRRKSRLNFHDIDYTSFKPHPMNNGEINKNLVNL